jgi:hypothetical protein
MNRLCTTQGSNVGLFIKATVGQTTKERDRERERDRESSFKEER